MKASNSKGDARTVGYEGGKIHCLWRALEQGLFPFMMNEVGGLIEKNKVFVAVCEAAVKPETFEGAVPGAMPRFAATNMALAVNADDHYRHHMPAGVVSRRMGFNKSTILDEMRALAEILRPCVRRLWRWLRESKVRHADETTWPCNGAHGQYAWGFFAKFVALFLFWKTRGGAVPGTVLAGVRDGVTVHDGYTAENNRAERGVRGLCIARKTSFGGQSEDALWVRGTMQSVMESLALLYDDPAEVLAEALDLYAKTGSKARARDFLFPKHRPAKRPGRPVRGAEAGGDALGIQPAAHGAAASARAAG